MFKRFLCFTLICVLGAAVFSALKFFNSYSPLFRYADTLEVYGRKGSFGAGAAADITEYAFINCKTGESCVLKNENKTPSDVAKELGGKILFAEETEAGVSYYGYSRKIKYKEIINGKVVNFQIFKSENRVKIGLPIIYGGF